MGFGATSECLRPPSAMRRRRRHRRRHPAHRRHPTLRRHHPCPSRLARQARRLRSVRSSAGGPATARPRLQGSETRTSCTRCILQPLSLQAHASWMLTAPLLAARCGAAPWSSSLQPGDPVLVAALCGEGQTRAGRARGTRPLPRPRPSAKPQAPGSAPAPSSLTAALPARAVTSTLNWSGARCPTRRRPARRRARTRARTRAMPP